VAARGNLWSGLAQPLCPPRPYRNPPECRYFVLFFHAATPTQAGIGQRVKSHSEHEVKARVLAWSAHVFTSLGLVAAAGIAVLIVWGGTVSFRGAFMLMWLATLIDAVDGTFARRARVREVLPEFDGRRLDDLIDFQTYTSLPLLLMWRADLLPGGWALLLLAPLIASAFGFSRGAAKTDDGYFLGFPSYWNIVVFYCYYLAPPPWLTATTVTLFAFLTLVPSRYLYPSQPGRLNAITNMLAVPWAILLFLITLRGPGPGANLVLISLYFPSFYLGVSWWISLSRTLKR
jgi:phosphatidylcholine synthase